MPEQTKPKYYLYFFEDLTVQSSIGYRKYIAGKEEYIVKGSGERNRDGLLVPAVITSQSFAEDAPEMAAIRVHIEDYIDNHDTLEVARDTKLTPATAWKKEQLIVNGVDLTDGVERKIWQDRPDLLTDAEKDALIVEWEASL